MADVNKRYFEALMTNKKVSLRGLAKQLGMSHSQLSLTFGGDRRMQLSEASQLATFFSRPLHEIIQNAGIAINQVTAVRVPVIGALRGDGTIEPTAKGSSERTSAPEGIPIDGIAVQARTAGTSLDFMDGWLFFATAMRGIAPDIMGRFALIQVAVGPLVLANARRRLSSYPETINDIAK